MTPTMEGVATTRRRPVVAHVATTDLTHRFLLLPQLEALRDEGWEVLAISAPGRWVEELTAAGIRHVPWHHATRSWHPSQDVRAFAELVSILRLERPAVLHCHTPKPGVLGRVAGRVAGIPLVLNTVHGLYAMPEDAPRRKIPVLAAEFVASRFADMDLYQSKEDLAWGRHWRIARPGRAVLLGNGVDLSRFGPRRAHGRSPVEIRRELGIDPDALVVGTVGRMVAEKGFREFFHAARAVRAAFPDVRFVAVGEPDPQKPDAISAREMEDAAADVVVTGWRDDVPDLLGAMDVFVLASWREGLPRSAIEAAASGLPMVLTDIRGCREVADGGSAAILVPPRDADALAEAIDRLVRDADLRAKFAGMAKAHASACFDERAVRSKITFTTRSLLPVERASGEAGTIRRARRADVARIAELHARSMPDAFMTKLGEPFLRRFHLGLVRDPEAMLVVAEVQGRIVGFACASPSMRRFVGRFLPRSGLGAGMAALPVALRTGLLRGFLENLEYARGAEGREEGAELIAIGVDEPYRGTGLGRRLAHVVLEAMAARGAERVHVLVQSANARAIGFYRNLGFTDAEDIVVHPTNESRLMVLPCVRD